MVRLTSFSGFVDLIESTVGRTFDPPLTPASQVATLDLDSLELIELWAATDEAGYPIDPDDLTACSTLGDAHTKLIETAVSTATTTGHTR